MRNRRLHDALRDFALEAAALLSADLDAGAELSFDVEETGGRRSVLYSYRPLTAEFIAPRWPRLRSLPAYGPAAAALGSGAAAYLRVRGVAGDDPEPALRALLERLYEDATSFEFPEERFERVYAEVEQLLYEHAQRVTVVAPLRGLRMESDRVDLGDGFALVRGDWTEAPPEAVWPEGGPPPGAEALPNVLCVIEQDAEASGELPLGDAAARFEALCTALRLFKPGGIALGPSGWARADAGPWRSFTLAAPGGPRGPEWALTRDEEEELREFLAIVAEAAYTGPIAWALGRFELGCERLDPIDGISDHLLALSALLGDGEDGGRPGVSLRVAALCADEEGRAALSRRVELAWEVQRWAISGGGGRAYAEVVGPEPPALLAAELEQHLRALLRDVLCGYLDADLRAVADDLLLRSGEPVPEPTTDELEPLAQLELDPEPEPEPDPQPARAPALPRSQLATSPPAGAPPEPSTPISIRRLDGGTPGEVPTELDERAEPDDGEIEPVTAEFAVVSRQASAAVDRPTDPRPTDPRPIDPRPIDPRPAADWDYDDPDDYSAPI